MEEIEKLFTPLQAQKDQFTRENYLAIAILLVLGVRKGELVEAKWEEFKRSRKPPIWNIPKERVKTGAAITVPLPKLVVD